MEEIGFKNEEERIREHIAEAKKQKQEIEMKIESLNRELGVELMKKASQEIINQI